MRIPRLIVFDVDGTLLDSTGICRPATVAMIERLRGHGIRVAIATGRPLALMPATVEMTGPIDFAACGNGSSLVDVASGEILRDATLPAELIEPAIAGLRARLPGVGFALELSTSVIEEADFVRRVPPSPHDPPVADALATWQALGAPAVRRLIAFHDDYDTDTAGLADIARPFVGDRCDLQYGLLPIVDIGLAGDHKAVALEVLVDHIGCSADDVIAFGDAGNDLEMLEWAGVGVAMGNAPDAVRAVADEITAHVDQGGVVDFLAPMLASIES